MDRLPTEGDGNTNNTNDLCSNNCSENQDQAPNQSNVVASCSKKKAVVRRLIGNQIPSDLVNNEELKAAISFSLPPNYEFEIPKTLWRIRQEQSRHVGLQFPEGLFLFANQIAVILKHFTVWPLDVTILADVTYGACCIDDLTSKSIGVDLLVHYGHSCLVPLHQTTLKCLYVFVNIIFDYQSLVNTVVTNFPKREQNNDSTFPSLPKTQPTQESLSQTLASPLIPPSASLTPPSFSSSLTFSSLTSPSLLTSDICYDGSPVVVLLGTIQYSSVLHAAAASLRDIYGSSHIIVPQEQPLTAGEVLGCTSPNLLDCCPQSPSFVVFISDGRFHLESAMIQNPSLPFFRYDPFTKKLLRERYDHSQLHRNRQEAIHRVKTSARSVGLILGTLGRQGSVGIFEKLFKLLRGCQIKTTLILMSELMPDRLRRLASDSKIDAFIQVACPRLSLDWDTLFGATPLLTPYEACVAFGSNTPYRPVYPMDYYSKHGGEWSNYSQEDRGGSIAQAQQRNSTSSLTELEKRRALIRERVSQRRQQQQVETHQETK